MPGGIAGNVLTRIGTVADQPPQAPAGDVDPREQRVDPVLVVQAGGGHQHGEEEPGGAHQDVTLAAVELLRPRPNVDTGGEFAGADLVVVTAYPGARG